MNEEIPKNYPLECKICDTEFNVISDTDDVVFYCPFCGIDLGDLTEDDDLGEDYTAFEEVEDF